MLNLLSDIIIVTYLKKCVVKLPNNALSKQATDVNGRIISLQLILLVFLVNLCLQLSLRDQHCAIHEASGEQRHLPGAQHDTTGQCHLKANKIFRFANNWRYQAICESYVVVTCCFLLQGSCTMKLNSSSELMVSNSKDLTNANIFGTN